MIWVKFKYKIKIYKNKFKDYKLVKNNYQLSFNVKNDDIFIQYFEKMDILFIKQLHEFKKQI